MLVLAPPTKIVEVRRRGAGVSFLARDKIFGALDFSKMNGPQINRYSLKIFAKPTETSGRATTPLRKHDV